MVVEKVYESEKELHTMFETLDDMEDDAGSFDDETGIDNELTFDDFADDIAKLGQEECEMLRIENDDDEDADGAAPNTSSDDRKVAAIEIRADDGLGRTEDDAIVLDDDEEEATQNVPPQPSEMVANPEETLAAAAATAAASNGNPLMPETLQDCRLYKIRIASLSLGVELSLYKGRAVVVRITKDRLERLGVDCKPALGDILVAINGWPLPRTNNIEAVVNLIRSSLLRPPTELTFAEYPAFKLEFYTARQNYARKQAERQAQLQAERNRAAAENVIELIDDEDD